MFQMTKRRNYRYVDSGYSQDVYIYTYIYITYVYNGEGYHGFLKDISVKKSDRLSGGGGGIGCGKASHNIDWIALPLSVSTPGRLIHRFNFCLDFGCYVVLIFGPCFSLGIHAVF